MRLPSLRTCTPLGPVPLALVLLLLAGGGEARARSEPKPRAGAAGGAGAAEQAERAERADHPVAGSIRDALLGDVIEPHRVSGGLSPRPPYDASTNESARFGSSCARGQSCVKTEDCGTTDVLFECAAGRVCCNADPGATSRAPPVVYPPPPPPHISSFPAPTPAPTPTSTVTASSLIKRDKVSSTPSPSTFRPTPNLLPDSRALLPGVQVCGKVITQNRITNGQIASPGQFPWMALLGYSKRGSRNATFLCGGTLISHRYVLTAAHCFSGQNRPVLVRLGEFDLSSRIDCDHDNVCAPPHEDIPVESIIPHPEFSLRNIKHDIALIRLKRNVTEFSDFVRPVCLPFGVNVTDDSKFKIAGWGKTDFKDTNGTNELQFTDVNGVMQDECNALQPPELQPLAPGQICAGGDKGKDACKGDSGGPLMITLVNNSTGPSFSFLTYQIGVVSYGPDTPCGTAPLPSIYTRVSTYIPWILKTIKP